MSYGKLYGMESAFQRFLFALLFSFALLIPRSNAQQISPNPVAPQELVKRAVNNELNPPDRDKKYLFQHHKKNTNGTQTMVYAQTRDAIAGLIIAINEKPLTAEQRKGESQRVQRFIDDPEELKKKQKQEKENIDRVSRIIRALPDAFLYQDDGKETGSTNVGRMGEELRRLSFQPNPKYDPPTRIEQILTGMQGHILIDPILNRIALIDGTLDKDVSFGWGILGHLDRGGHIMIRQADVGDKHWQMTGIDMSFTGKVLLFKTITAQSTETYSDFHPVAPDTTFAQGVDLLKKYESQWLLSQNQSK